MMMQTTNLPARLQRFPDLGIEYVPEVREKAPTMRWQRQEVKVSKDATLAITALPESPYYARLAAIRGEDWMGSMEAMDLIGVSAAASSFVRKGELDRHGEPLAISGLTMLIVYVRKYRVMYDAPWRPGVVSQPSCGSLTGLTGRGNPGARCKGCQWDRFGTAVAANSDGEVWNTGAKKCSERLWLFGFEFNTHGEEFDPKAGIKPHPVLVDLPWGSRKTALGYLEALSKDASDFQPWEVITELALVGQAGQSKSAHLTPVGLMDSSSESYVQVVGAMTDAFRGMALDWLEGFERRAGEGKAETEWDRRSREDAVQYDAEGNLVLISTEDDDA